MANNDVLSKILFEAKSYNTIDDIEKLVEIGTDLSMVPIQPLYVSLLSSSTDQVAELMAKFSKEQKQTFVDLDLWKRDCVDVNSFEFWIEVYSKVQDLDLIQEFVETEDFLLYLKSRINLHTFDVEDPMYPDHDYYFLTDDMLLLVEYSEDFRYPNEIKYMIRNLYDKLGVENAYAYLFKMINDSFSSLQENLYQIKKDRLRDYGFVDYYDALENTYDFLTYKQVENFILKKESLTPGIDSIGKNQSLHSSALVSFDSEMDNILKELALIKDDKRLEFLHFTFIRLVNSTITLHDALKGGRVELTRIGKVTRSLLDLGLQKVKSTREFKEEESVFETYDFFDLFRIGSSLIGIEKKKIKKALRNTPFEKDDYEFFLGTWWSNFLANSDEAVPKTKAYGAAMQAKPVNSLETHAFWCREVKLFRESIPFINSFFEMISTLKKEGKLQSDFYLNYDSENIDFESILLSSFINYSLGSLVQDSDGNEADNQNIARMGVTILELKEFFNLYFQKVGEEYILLPFDSEKITTSIDKFVEMFGFDRIENFSEYLYGVLLEHLSGYEFDTLSDDDYKHIGGPILLDTSSKN